MLSVKLKAPSRGRVPRLTAPRQIETPCLVVAVEVDAFGSGFAGLDPLPRLNLPCVQPHYHRYLQGQFCPLAQP